MFSIGVSAESLVIDRGSEGWVTEQYISPAIEDFCRDELTKATEVYRTKVAHDATELMVAE